MPDRRPREPVPHDLRRGAELLAGSRRPDALRDACRRGCTDTRKPRRRRRRPAARRPPAARPTAIAACDKPGGLGLSRIVEIDTTGGPGFGYEHFKQYDFLRDKEVVLTFDDGPWPENTAAVLKALADNCLKATFFEIGNTPCGIPRSPNR